MSTVTTRERVPVPRDRENDYTREAAEVRAEFALERTAHCSSTCRAPAFVFESAREAREFGRWLDEHFDEIKRAAEATTSSSRLQDIEQ